MKKPLVSLLLLLAATSHANLCDGGRRQSPIDIGHATKQNLPALQFSYSSLPLKLADDGHTVRVRLAQGGHLQIGPQRYSLQQFHFHTPGGDRIAGENFPMVAHLLHKSSSGQLLAVAVLFRTGEENPLLKTLLPLIPAHADGDHLVPGVRVNAADLLPAQRGYYRYSGSLTSQPCTEGVDWIVLKQPLQLSEAQLAQYRARFADNARAVQPLHSRVVLESQ